MTMDIIDKRIYSCNEAICKNIESLQANERGLLSQNILSQLRNFLECVFLKIYVASSNSIAVSIISWLSVSYVLNGRKVTVWILYRYEMAKI